MSGIVLKITIEDTHPPVWRRLVVPENMSFYDLHRVIQLVFGWEDMHMHIFEAPQNRFEIVANSKDAYTDFFMEKKLPVSAVAEHENWIRYVYDMGDDWRHKIVFEKLLQATGRSFYSTIGQVLGAVVNIILDPLMIFGIGPFPEMGIRGAALATVIGQIFGMALGLWGVFRQQKVLNVNMREFKWRGQTIKDIYRVGLPGIVMQSVVSVMTAGMNGILIAFSQTAVNVLGVYFKLQTFVFMPVFGLNQGALPVMGYNYGARNRKRLMGAYKITLTAAVVIMALGLVLFQLLPEQMLMLFVDKSDAAAAQEMIEVGVPALKTISLSFLGAAFGIINSTLFQATARGMNSLIVSVCRQLVVILPAAWILGQQFGLNAVWYAFPIAEIAAFFISYILLWREYRTELRFLGIEREAKA